MSGSIYLLGKDKKLVTMEEQAYDSEALLQELLADYPSLLAGDQINPGAPRKWLLVKRETGIPGEEGGGDRWSVDHLFLDQDAIPTLVEVKRSSDTRIRREVVGQMLDYAANAVVHWPVERLRAMLETELKRTGRDLDEAITELGVEDLDEFWADVKTNLQAGRVRLVFVADEIPPELARVIEFLNQQMDPAEVLAVEVRQYVGEGRQTLVPRVLGQTVQAQQKKSRSNGNARQWDEPSFFAKLLSEHGDDVVRVAKRLLEWAQAADLQIDWGRGEIMGSFIPLTQLADGAWHWTFSVWTYGTVEIQFQLMKSRGPFASEAARRELRDKLNAIPGIDIPADKIGKRPNVPLAALAEPGALDEFLKVFDWYLARVRSAH
ncbi:MAG: hypothetical protein DHS20C15_11810 [Planctomycetota bacterium]|nr:MAG: hypothetical protein DHS20C15_11810 [Planctomycetota bacterium]